MSTNGFQIPDNGFWLTQVSNYTQYVSKYILFASGVLRIKEIESGHDVT